MPTLTTSHITALAGDAAALKAARGLAKPGKWVSIGANELGAWGECQGSSSTPYQVQVDFNDTAFKCACPSRKLPCKHVLALMLMYAEGIGTFAATAPAWFEEWRTKRQERAERKVAKQLNKTAPDPAKQAKHLADKLQKVRAGASELDLWMRDLMRDGIADLPTRPVSFWKDIATRMVDAQAPGLSRRIEDLAAALYSGAEWPHKILGGLGQIRLLLDALTHYDNLPEPLQADVRTALGWGQDKDAAIMSGDRIEDIWTVAGVTFDDNANLTERRVWLLGAQSQRAVLILDFAYGGHNFDAQYTVGTCFNGIVALFPSAMPQRGLLLQIISPIAPALTLPLGTSWIKNLDRVASALAANPFVWRLPITLHKVALAHQDNTLCLVDDTATILPAHITENNLWLIAAVSGGLGVSMFGEWYAGTWYPLAAYCGMWLNFGAASR